MKNLKNCKETLDKIIKWCNDNDACEDADNIETYLYAMRELTLRSIDHTLSLDWDFISANYDSWDEYLMENYGINLNDFCVLTDKSLPDLWSTDQSNI